MIKQLIAKNSDNKTLEISEENSDKIFSIDLDELNFDSTKFYECFFSNVNEEINYIIDNKINIEDKDYKKRADKTFNVIKTLIESICLDINELFNVNELFNDENGDA